MIFLVLLTLSGCSGQYWSEPVTPLKSKLSTQSGFYIVQPKNGTYSNRQYPKSGAQTAQAVTAALGKKVQRTETGTSYEDTPAAIAKAKSKGLQYVVEPAILHWEDRATEWSGKTDRLTIRLTVYDVSNGTTLTTNVVSGEGKLLTFGGDHPQDLLSVPMKHFVDSLF
jgi:hypothetical protein